MNSVLTFRIRNQFFLVIFWANYDSFNKLINLTKREHFSKSKLKALYCTALIGWLVVLGLTAFEIVFQSISGRLPKSGRKKKEMIDETKNVQTTPTRTFCKRSRPLSYSNPNKQDALALQVYPAPSRHPTTPAPL